MEQFSLEKWLQDKSRKVVTRRGNSVRIICTDRKHGEDDLPIVFLEESNGGEFLLTCRKDGRCDNYDTQYDLFFADEKEELTEFEKEISNLINFYGNEVEETTVTNAGVKEIASKLLDLARKELEESNVIVDKDKYIKNCDYYYEHGKQDALKSLPKFKKATEHKEFAVHVCVMDYYMFPFLDTEVNEGDYYIELSDLKNLPKEE